MSAKKPRKFSIQKAGNPNSEINVTPLVDVVLVLLIIFMVLTPLIEKDLEVKVPDTEKVETTSEIPPGQLIVSLDEHGQIKLNGENVADADYVELLKKRLENRKAADKLVFFMPEEKANYGKLIGALDGAKLAGAEFLGMMTELPEGVQNPAGGAPEGGAAPPEGAAPPVPSPP